MTRADIEGVIALHRAAKGRKIHKAWGLTDDSSPIGECGAGIGKTQRARHHFTFIPERVTCILCLRSMLLAATKAEGLRAA